MDRERDDEKAVSVTGRMARYATALALLLNASCASEAGSGSTDAAVDHATPSDTVVEDLGSTRDGAMDSTVPRCVPGMSVACACVGGASGAQTCSAEGVYGTCVCPDASIPTDAATDAWTLDIPVRPLGPRLITPQSISRTTTQRPTFRWVLPEGVTRARVTVARNRALTMDVRTGIATGTSWRPTEPLTFAVWFWRVEGLGDDGGVVWTSPTWEFRAPRRDTAVDSSWGTWRDFNGDGYDDVVILGLDVTFLRGRSLGLSAERSVLFSPLRLGLAEYIDGYVSDLNGDGLSDLAIVAIDFSLATQIYVFWGRAAGLNREPDLTIRRNDDGHSPAFQTAIGGDFDSDGVGDLLVAMNCNSFTDGCSSDRANGTSILSGTVSNMPVLRDTGLFASPSDARVSIGAVGDVDRDGMTDFLEVHSPGSYLLRSLPSTNTPFLLPEENVLRLMGDFDANGDGFLDLTNSQRERVSLFSWTVRALSRSAMSVTTAPDSPSSLGPQESFGSTLSFGDVNGDGFSDLVVGAREVPISGTRVGPGRTYLYLGGVAGFGPNVATWSGQRLESSGMFERFGEAVDSGADYDGDGYDDVTILVPGTNRIEIRFGERNVCGPAPSLGPCIGRRSVEFEGLISSPELGLAR